MTAYLTVTPKILPSEALLALHPATCSVSFSFRFVEMNVHSLAIINVNLEVFNIHAIVFPIEGSNFVLSIMIIAGFVVSSFRLSFDAIAKRPFVKHLVDMRVSSLSSIAFFSYTVRTMLMHLIV